MNLLTNGKNAKWNRRMIMIRCVSDNDKNITVNINMRLIIIEQFTSMNRIFRCGKIYTSTNPSPPVRKREMASQKRNRIHSFIFISFVPSVMVGVLLFFFFSPKVIHLRAHTVPCVRTKAKSFMHLLWLNAKRHNDHKVEVHFSVVSQNSYEV